MLTGNIFGSYGLPFGSPTRLEFQVSGPEFRVLGIGIQLQVAARLRTRLEELLAG